MKRPKLSKTIKTTKATRMMALADRTALSEKLGLKKEDHRRFLKNIFLSRKLDNTEIMMRKQNTAFFQISGAGHEGILTAMAEVLRPSYDYFIPYYRDRALCLGLGVSPLEMLCQANGNVGDTSSLGRQMPAHWATENSISSTKAPVREHSFYKRLGLPRRENTWSPSKPTMDRHGMEMKLSMFLPETEQFPRENFGNP